MCIRDRSKEDVGRPIERPAGPGYGYGAPAAGWGAPTGGPGLPPTTATDGPIWDEARKRQELAA